MRAAAAPVMFTTAVFVNEGDVINVTVGTPGTGSTHRRSVGGGDVSPPQKKNLVRIN